MLRQWVLAGAALGVATATLLLTPAIGAAQFRVTPEVAAFNRGMYAPMTGNYYMGYPTYGGYSGYATPSGYYYDGMTGIRPTNMTSINYPTVYGAYTTFPYSSYTYGAMQSPYAVTPSGYASPLYTTTTSGYAAPRTMTLRSDRSDRRPARDEDDPDALSAVIDLQVPSDATVWIQGKRMTQRGSLRQFISPPLEDGQAYSYNIKATWTEAGRDVSRTERVIVHAGDRKSLSILGEGGGRATLRGRLRSDLDRDRDRDRDYDRDRDRDYDRDRDRDEDRDR